MAMNVTDLPNEVIYHILLYLPPVSVPKVQQVSRLFNDVLQPILWRYHCRTQFEYWSPEHGMKEKFAAAAAETNWKKTFAERHTVDRETVGQVDSILSTQRGRIDKTEKILARDYDAKDALLRQINVADDVEDVLARRYYSDAVLGSLHRKIAIAEWVKLKDGESVPLERALTAFDMFVLHGRKGDFDETSALFDQIAERFRTKEENLEPRTTRKRAIALLRFLREVNLLGINEDDHYHDLRNNFIGIAMRDENHLSLPLISVAIFCCVSSRLGIDAQPCGFPFHVLAIIKPPIGHSLDEEAAQAGEIYPSIYLDPFRSGQEIEVQNLVAQLRSMGVPSWQHQDFLGASTTTEIVIRCAKNIITSVQALPRQHGADPISTVHSFPEMDGALYAALWSLVILSGGAGVATEQAATEPRSRYMPFFVEKMQKSYLMDVGLIEEHVVPLMNDNAQRESLIDMMRVIRRSDNAPHSVKERTPDLREKVRYSVGQLFHHKRYHYQGIITGWDSQCEQGDTWMAHMGVHTLSKGQNQAFYHVLVEDKTVRYVAEENILIKPQEVSPELMALAGQHFKRWDASSGMFISNIRDEYPDD